VIAAGGLNRVVDVSGVGNERTKLIQCPFLGCRQRRPIRRELVFGENSIRGSGRADTDLDEARVTIDADAVSLEAFSAARGFRRFRRGGGESLPQGTGRGVQ